MHETGYSQHRIKNKSSFVFSVHDAPQYAFNEGFNTWKSVPVLSLNVKQRSFDAACGDGVSQVLRVPQLQVTINGDYSGDNLWGYT